MLPTGPFAFVPQEDYGIFASWCTKIREKIAENVSGVTAGALTPAQIKANIKSGLMRLDDYYKLAQVLAEGEDSEVDLGYCRIGGKNSMVHGAAPWAVNLPSSAADGQALPLERHGVKCANLAPDPEHCLMVSRASSRRPSQAACLNIFAVRPSRRTSSTNSSGACQEMGMR